MIEKEIKNRIEKELKRIKPSFELEYVCHMNDIKADEYLYLVIAEDTNLHHLIPKECRYIVYTYNNSKQSLECGHYNIKLGSALELIMNKRKEFEK